MKKLVTIFGLLLAASALALTACGSSGDSTDSSSSDTATFQEDGYPFTFEYPGDWQALTDITLNNQLGSNRGANVKGVGLDDTNAIVLTTYTLNQEVTQDNLDQAKAELDKLLQQVDSTADGVVGDVGGYPSITYDSIPVTDPAGATDTLIALFDGTSEYLITCQWDSDHADEVQAACDQAKSTLTKAG
jgi:hypothetical protein